MPPRTDESRLRTLHNIHYAKWCNALFGLGLALDLVLPPSRDPPARTRSQHHHDEPAQPHSRTATTHELVKANVVGLGPGPTPDLHHGRKGSPWWIEVRKGALCRLTSSETESSLARQRCLGTPSHDESSCRDTDRVMQADVRTGADEPNHTTQNAERGIH